MSQYWFTTHWPKFIGGRDTLHVYVKDQSFAPGLARGDRVFIYEFLTGPTLLQANGEKVTRERGKGGIVCEAEVVTGFEERSPDEAVERYTNGKQANWRWIARTDNRKFGFVPRVKVNDCLGYEAGYKYFGFNRGQGIILLDDAAYSRLNAAFHT